MDGEAIEIDRNRYTTVPDLKGRVFEALQKRGHETISPHQLELLLQTNSVDQKLPKGVGELALLIKPLWEEIQPERDKMFGIW
jgi:hypothetical protein